MATLSIAQNCQTARNGRSNRTCFLSGVLCSGGCRNARLCLFGVRHFSECCALEKVGIITEQPCRLANGAVIAPYVFESCAKLSHIHLPQVCAKTDTVTPSSPPGGLSHGSFHSAGIGCVTLGQETIFLASTTAEQSGPYSIEPQHPVLLISFEQFVL